MHRNNVSKQHLLGQFMTPLDVASGMCEKIKSNLENWIVFDPACGDGNLLMATALKLKDAGIDNIKNKLIGFDIDPEMAVIAKSNLAKELDCPEKEIHIYNTDCLDSLRLGLFSNEFEELLENVTVVIANPPYGNNLELEFFERVNDYFSNQAEMVFLMPLAFVDRVKNIDFKVIKGRPLGVTTGNAIVHHIAGSPYLKNRVVEKLKNLTQFEVLTGVKLYAKGEGTPPQTKELVECKPYSSSEPKKGWLPCLRTGDISKYNYTADRLWVDYGDHLAHPKNIERFKGPKIFVRRIPIWSTKTLGAVFCDETVLCAGDIMIIRHKNNNEELLKGLCVYLNSQEAAGHIFDRRPSVKHRDSYPKISGKDLNYLLDHCKLSDDYLLELSQKYGK